MWQRAATSFGPRRLAAPVRARPRMKRRNRSRLTGKGKRPRKALPGQLSRVVQPGPGDGQARYTSFSRTDRAPQLHLDDSLLVLEGEKVGSPFARRAARRR